MAGQLWGVNSLGGYMYSLELSDILRTAVQPLCKFRQFCDAKDFTDKGLHKGQIFTWNVYNDVSAQGTTLVETNTSRGDELHDRSGHRHGDRAWELRSLHGLS